MKKTSSTDIVKRPMGRDRVIFNTVSYIVLAILAILCVLPFILMVSGSFSTQDSILRYGFSIFPRTFTVEAYEIIFRSPQSILNAYGVTILVTLVGTLLGLSFMSMASYVLACPEFRYRNQMSFFFYFTSIFGGGLVPWYIFNIRFLHFKDNFIALILPVLINVTYLLVLKSYMKSIPDSLYESARIEGAGDFTIFVKIAVPLSKAGLATIGLFTALGYWNDWYNAMLFIDDVKMQPLQYFLNNILTKAAALSAASARSGVPASSLPTEAMKLAMTVVATGPIILLYPYLQRFFVKGVTIGAVKG